MVVLLLIGGSAAAQNKTIVILAPHPDDEALCCAGVIQNALQQGNAVKIVVVTNGDSYYPGVPLGYQREAESVAGMAVLGLGEQDIIFMGYGDQSLLDLYQSTSPATVICEPRLGWCLLSPVPVRRSRAV
jgi:LmbE family N-acetylglucosaminyl deacetylase